jgi:hypothetical protein
MSKHFWTVVLNVSIGREKTHIMVRVPEKSKQRCNDCVAIASRRMNLEYAFATNETHS